VAAKPNSDLAALVVGSITRAEQLDMLHLSVTKLFDMISSGDLDIIISQAGKSASSKQRFLEKVFADIASPELRTYLKKQPLVFFSGNTLEPFLAALRAEAGRVGIVKLTIALELRENDIAVLARQVSEQLDRPIAFSITIDPSIIGGAIVQYGSYISDSTLRMKLDSLEDTWKEAVDNKEAHEEAK
jgi:F-type H+-transporting ATPase subunit delta